MAILGAGNPCDHRTPAFGFEGSAISLATRRSHRGHGLHADASNLVPKAVLAMEVIFLFAVGRAMCTSGIPVYERSMEFSIHANIAKPGPVADGADGGGKLSDHRNRHFSGISFEDQTILAALARFGVLVTCHGNHATGRSFFLSVIFLDRWRESRIKATVGTDLIYLVRPSGVFVRGRPFNSRTEVGDVK